MKRNIILQIRIQEMHLAQENDLRGQETALDMVPWSRNAEKNTRPLTVVKRQAAVSQPKEAIQHCKAGEVGASLNCI